LLSVFVLLLLLLLLQSCKPLKVASLLVVLWVVAFLVV
jgi:hypothetical protein